MKLAVAGFEHLAQGPDAKPLLRIAQAGELWREHAVDKHELAGAVDGLQFQRIFRARQRGRIGGSSERSTGR